MSKNKSKKYGKAISTAIISALAYIVLGFVMIFYPDKVSIALCYTLGGALTVYGLFNLITYFSSWLISWNKKRKEKHNPDGISGRLQE